MTLLNVDSEKCIRDGACLAVCPASIIEFKEEGSIPSLISGGEEICIACGHCMAVCPEGAMAHEKMKPEDCPVVREDWHVGAEQMAHLLRSRRSIRVYENKPVERKLLKELIDMARYAPSGHNLQPVNWLVIEDGREVQHLAGHIADWMKSLIEQGSPLVAMLHLDRVVSAWQEGKDRICRNAPHVIVAHAPKYGDITSAVCTIALTYLELAAPSLGLGACWAGFFTAAANLWPPMQKALGLPEGHLSFGAMMIGWPMYSYRRLPLRNPARVTWR
jgi:nitroreductase/NAD-dependent dihydropyrimidine dehydrogenase PreA subunit